MPMGKAKLRSRKDKFFLAKKALAFFAVVSLVLSGAQPGVAGMIDRAMNSHPMGISDTHSHSSLMDHGAENGPVTNGTHLGRMAAADGEMTPDHSCCPDQDTQAPCEGHCCATSWLACAIHCGIAAPAYTVAADFTFSHPRLSKERSTDAESHLMAFSDPPPSHPPKLISRA